MPKATKLPSGNWRVRVYDHTDADGKKHYLSFTAATKKEAEYMAADFNNKKNEERRAESGNMTLGEAMERYIESMDKILSPSTIYGYNQIYRLRLKDLQKERLSKLTNGMIQTAINAEASHLSPKTVRNISALLSATLKRYRPDFVVRVNLPKKKKTEIKIPTQEDVQKILNYVKDTDMELPLLLAACLGLRRSEIIGLKWDKIDFENKTIRIDTAVVFGKDSKFVEKKPKSAAGYRTLTVAPSIMDVLLREKAKAQTDNVVTLSGAAIYNRFDHVLQALELPHYRLHDLRHYHASVMLAMGIPDKYAQQRMGHATDSMLKNVYQHIMAQKKNEIDNTLDNYFDEFLK